MEDAFFDRGSSTGPSDFQAKITTYWLYFNLVPPNRGKEWQSQFQILQAEAPALVGAVLYCRRSTSQNITIFTCRFRSTRVTILPSFHSSL